MNNWQDLATEQRMFGNQQPSRQTINFSPRKNYLAGSGQDKKQAFPEYGHMTFLRKLGESDQEVILITSLGYVVRGFVKAVDEQSVSLRCPNKDDNGYRTRVIFKSNIVEFSPVKGIEKLADELEQRGYVDVHGGIGATQRVPC